MGGSLEVQRSSGQLSHLREQPSASSRPSVLIFRKISRLIRTSAWRSSEFVPELQCKKAAQEVEAETDYKR